MKVLKYIVLLLLLSLGTLSVFVATKDGSYTVKESKIIDVPRNVVYKYVADRQNWDSINPWRNDTWKITQTQKSENESILHHLLVNQKVNEITLEFRDTLKNQTLLTWSTKGNQSFKDKFLGIIGRGTANNFGEKFSEGLTAINTILTREVKSYEIKVDGFIKRDTIFYIQRPLVCKPEEMPKYIKHYLPKLQELLKATDTPTNGNPFIIYHKMDSIANKVTFSVAIPTKKKIYTSGDSDIFNGQINPTGTVKATLTGNYTHKREVLNKIDSYLLENRFEALQKEKVIDVLVKNISTDKSASKWITETYVPAKPVKIAIKVRPAKKDTVNTIIESHFENPTIN